MHDRNGTYTAGTYSDGRPVHVYGERGGFAYLAFTSDLSWVTKVPASWVTAASAPRCPGYTSPVSGITYPAPSGAHQLTTRCGVRCGVCGTPEPVIRAELEATR